MSVAQENLMQVILSPRISEKSTRLADKYGQVVLKVASSADKPSIKAAVELLFKVKVKDVRVLNVKGKKRKFGRREGQTKRWKKAYVALQDGYDIDFSGAE